MSDANYRPSGNLQGDTKAMPRKFEGSMPAGGSINKSLNGTPKSDLRKGYCAEGKITNATKSDKGFA